MWRGGNIGRQIKEDTIYAFIKILDQRVNLHQLKLVRNTVLNEQRVNIFLLKMNDQTKRNSDSLET